jgi:hypothetical protein
MKMAFAQPEAHADAYRTNFGKITELTIGELESHHAFQAFDIAKWFCRDFEVDLLHSRRNSDRIRNKSGRPM